MLYLANPCDTSTILAMGMGRLGMIDTPYQGKGPSVAAAHAVDAVWCADNGAFSDRWSADVWWAWLTAQVPHAATCLFAVCPDVVGDPHGTRDLADLWLDPIRALGFRVAYVAQNGQDPTRVPWDRLDALFIGGTKVDGHEWKIGPEARALVREAKARDLWVHMGRVNSGKRWRYAEAIGCDSVDGTYLTFGPTINLSRLLRWTTPSDQMTLNVAL